MRQSLKQFLIHRHLRRHALVIFARESFLNIPVSHSKNLSRHPIISHFGLRWDLHFHMVNVHCSLFAWHSSMKKKFFLVRIIWTEIQRELSIPICVIVNLCILVKATFGEPPHLRHYIRSREIIKLQTVKFPDSEEAQQRSIGWSSLSLWWLESIVGLFRAHKQTFLVWNFSPSSSARAHALKQKKERVRWWKIKMFESVYEPSRLACCCRRWGLHWKWMRKRYNIQMSMINAIFNNSSIAARLILRYARARALDPILRSHELFRYGTAIVLTFGSKVSKSNDSLSPEIWYFIKQSWYLSTLPKMVWEDYREQSDEKWIYVCSETIGNINSSSNSIALNISFRRV